MPNTRPYSQNYDNGTAKVIGRQGDDPVNLRFDDLAAANARTVLDGSVNPTLIADATTAIRGGKNIIWSSEGFAHPLGFTVPALTANQKKATGNANTNLALSVPTGNSSAAIPSGFSLPTTLDVSAYKNLVLITNLVSFTAGSSPTIQFEIDFLDDAGTPNSFVLWKPTALSAAAAQLVNIGAQIPFVQAAAAANAAGTGFGAISIPSGLTAYSIPLLTPPTLQFAWTVTGTPTAIAWTAFLYGLN